MSAVSSPRLAVAIAPGLGPRSTCLRTPPERGPAIVQPPNVVPQLPSSNDRPCRSHLHHALLMFRPIRLWHRDVESLVRPPGQAHPAAEQVAGLRCTLAILLDDQQPAAAGKLDPVARHQ